MVAPTPAQPRKPTPSPASLPPLSALDPIRFAGPVELGSTVRFGASVAAGLHARQLRVSEAFTLHDSRGIPFRASVKDLSDDRGAALIYEQMQLPPESPLELTLICAVLARQRMTVVMQKATEIGCNRIYPALSEHSVPVGGLEHEKAHAWPNQVVRAVRQCRRARVPETAPAAPLVEVLARPAWSQADLRVFLDDTGESGVIPDTAGSCVLAVGPEGGWSAEERELLLERGAIPWRLSGRILRAETAVLAGLVLLQARFGDF